MTDTVANIKLALTSTFFDALNNLPKSIFKKTKEFIADFPKKAMSSGFNYENIKNAKDSNYRSVRLNDNYRAIIYHPEVGNVYLLLWVDSHDNAYKWACTHVCKINSHTSSLQVYETLPVDEQPAEIKDKESNQNRSIQTSELLFKSFSDEDLLSVGVPDEMLSIVRSCCSRDDLEVKKKLLPIEAFEALVWLSEGETLEAVKGAYQKSDNKSETVVDEWEKAISKAEAYGSVRVIENDEDMRAIVDADLASWRIFLHPVQRKIVNSKSMAPCLVRGSAGTGKTVVALHRAVRIIQNPDWDKSKKLLFTTFTANLATDIEQNIRMLCPRELKNLIEVTNIDAWVTEYLRKMQISLKVVYQDKMDFGICWNNAMNFFDGTELPFNEQFYKEEFNRVILPQEITTERDYLKAVRKGRGKVISRAQRKQIWPFFETVREQLKMNKCITMEDACFLACRLINDNPYSVNYGAVIVDETQDLSAPTLKLLALLATPKDQDNAEPNIFMVGDGHQRIYSRTASLSQCGINVRGGRSKKLKITYRTTDEIRKLANAVLENESINDMDEGEENFKGDLSVRHGLVPEIKQFSSFNEEADWIIDRIGALTDVSSEHPYELKDICVVGRTKNDVEAYRKYISNNSYETVEITPHHSDDTKIEGVRFATMHRVKGLEFKIIFLVNASENVIPLRVNDFDDELELERHIKNERSLFYVATTRARDALFISCYGKVSPFLKNTLSTKA